MKTLKILLLSMLPLWLWSQNSTEDPIVKLFEKAQNLHFSKNVDFKIYDPFRLPPAPPKVKASVPSIVDQPLPVLGGIVNHQAFLNHRWYHVGQKVGIYMIISISPHEVTLANDGKLYTLHVPLGSKKLEIGTSAP